MNELYAVTLTFDLEHLQHIARDVMKLSLPHLNAIELSAAELLRFQCVPDDFEHCVTCCARLWDNFHQV